MGRGLKTALTLGGGANRQSDQARRSRTWAFEDGAVLFLTTRRPESHCGTVNGGS